MNKLLVGLIVLLLSSTLGIGQTFKWSDYLVENEVDSIVVFKTYKGGTYQITKKDSFNLSKIELEDIAVLNRKISSCFYDHDFPLNDYSDYEELYEVQKIFTKELKIKELVQLFPKVDCANMSVMVTRCPPSYRDVVVFYKDKNPFFALKICFGCTYFSSTPSSKVFTHCLAVESVYSKLTTFWLKEGLIDLYK